MFMISDNEQQSNSIKRYVLILSLISIIIMVLSGCGTNSSVDSSPVKSKKTETEVQTQSGRSDYSEDNLTTEVIPDNTPIGAEFEFPIQESNNTLES